MADSSDVGLRTDVICIVLVIRNGVNILNVVVNEDARFVGRCALSTGT